MNLLKAIRDLFPHEPDSPFPDDSHFFKRRTQWVRQEAERKRNVPQGLALCWSIEESLEEPVTLSPDGRYITSSARDATVRLWDPSTGTEVRALSAHAKPVSAIAWSASGLLASGAKDTTIHLWETETGEVIRTLTGHSRAISTLAWSPNGNALASGAEDKSVQIWDVSTGTQRHILLGHPRNVRCLAWLRDEQVLASGDDGGQIRLWNTQTGEPQRTIDAHANGVRCLAWSPAEEALLASGGQDATVRLWDSETGRQIHRLEGHTRQVTSIAFSLDGRILVSQSVSDGAEACFWRTDTWELLASLPVNPFRSHFPLAFQTNAPLLLTGGDTMDEVRIWQVDIDVLLQGRKPTMQYSNAKVVLMGDSGVGKTGLFRGICGETFIPTESTHARRVLVMDREEVPLHTQGVYHDKGMLRERREILLWDLAGQPGYRVIHQLHLDEVTLGLVVFDGRNETDPFAGVYHWDRALRQAHNVSGQSLPLKKLLVAARVDRGGIAVSKERTDELIEELGFDGYIETSAKEHYNIDKLRETIKKTVDWDAVPRVTSNELFETIKAFLLERKQTEHILTRVPDLYSLLISSYKIGPDSEELHAQFERCIALVESRDLIKRFRFGKFVLLRPELLDAYASALVNSVRDEPDGLGSILEAKAKNCQFRMPRDERIQDEEQEKLLLLAMIEDMLRHELALLEQTPEGNYLLFPSQSTRVNHELPDPEGKALLFTFEGAIQNIYARLAVRLSRSELFKKKDLWKDAVTFTARAGGQCGLFLETIGEGRGRLTLFFNPKAPATEETRFYFEDYVGKHLQRWAITGSVRRFRLFTCPNPSCQEPIPHSTVLKRRKRGFDWLLCSNCETRIDLADSEERLSSVLSPQTLEMDSAADRQRRLDVLRSTRREEVEINIRLGKPMSYYDMFLCYSPDDRPVIEQIGDQLLERNILPWLDEWEVRPGQNWQRVLSTQIASINAVIVFLGKDSPASWHDSQVDHLLRAFAKQQHIIVPVILPECERLPQQLPSYIKGPWVDMRVSEPDPIESLIERIETK